MNRKPIFVETNIKSKLQKAGYCRANLSGNNTCGFPYILKNGSWLVAFCQSCHKRNVDNGLLLQEVSQ